MKEYAISTGNVSIKEVKRRNIFDIPSGRKAREANRQRELDFYSFDKMPGGASLENVKIMGKRLAKLELKTSGAIPGSGKPEWR